MSGSSPSVSVVIPCYAQAHFLADAIESVLRQTYPPLEIIVIDDGSPDHAREVAGRYSEVRCISQPNQGLSAARNRGLHNASGDFIVFLDADDRLLQNALAAGVHAFAARPWCGFVWGYRRLVDTSGQSLPAAIMTWEGPARYETLLRRNVIGPPLTVMFRRPVVHELGGFCVDQPYAEDYEMYLRVARGHETWCHQELIAEYRIHAANMSHNRAGMLAGHLAALDRQEPAIGADPGLRRALRDGRRHAMEWLDGLARVEELALSAHRGRWAAVMAGAAMLLVKYPRVFFEELGRWLRRRISLRVRPAGSSPIRE